MFDIQIFCWQDVQGPIERIKWEPTLRIIVLSLNEEKSEGHTENLSKIGQFVQKL